MSKNIYAGKIEVENGQKIVGPIFDFDCADPEVFSHEEEDEEGYEVPIYVKNPKYVPNSHMNLAEGNCYAVFAEIGIKLDVIDRLDPKDLLVKIVLRLASQIECSYVKERLESLQKLVILGIQNNCEFIAVC